jgi:hypothetical protein
MSLARIVKNELAEKVAGSGWRVQGAGERSIEFPLLCALASWRGNFRVCTRRDQGRSSDGWPSCDLPAPKKAKGTNRSRAR